jgi:hypothetical protein
MVKKVMLTDEESATNRRWVDEQEAAHMRAVAVDAYNQGEEVKSPPPYSSPPFVPKPVEMTDEELATARRWSAEWEAARKAARMRAVAANNQGEEVPSSPPDSSQCPSTPPPQIIRNVHHIHYLHQPPPKTTAIHPYKHKLATKTRAVVAAMGLRRILQTFYPSHWMRNMQQGLKQFFVHSLSLCPHSGISGWCLRNLIQNFN